jgi:hypothetical protein
MTGPGQPAPGWYPDPDGAPGMVRWWNGISWSEVATPAGPGVDVRSSPVLAPPPPVRPEILSDELPPSPRSRTPLVVGLAVLALVVTVVLALVTGGSGGGAGVAAPTADTGSLPSISPPTSPSFAPGTVRIIDQAAGISYPYLGEGWREWTFGPQVETSQMVGQYFTTQEITPDQTSFIAQCTSGPLADGYGWSGSPSLASTVTSVADAVRTYYYPAPNDRKVMRDEPRTVDGHAAHLYEFQLSWHVPGYDSTGERAALLLIDVGRPAPALLYLSIPNTHAELYSVIDRVIKDVRVL